MGPDQLRFYQHAGTPLCVHIGLGRRAYPTLGAYVVHAATRPSLALNPQLPSEPDGVFCSPPSPAAMGNPPHRLHGLPLLDVAPLGAPPFATP